MMLFIFVQSLKREPALLNAYQVPIAIFQNVKAVIYVYPEEATVIRSPFRVCLYSTTSLSLGFSYKWNSCFGRISMMRLKYVGSCSGTDLSLNPVLMAFVQRFNSQVHAYY